MKNKSYKFRFYPTKEQEENLAKTFGCVRFVYNKALSIRSYEWSENQVRVSYSATSIMLTQWRKSEDTLWLQDVSSVVLQASLRNLQFAFDNFWRKTSNYPKFKKKSNINSATYYRNGFTFNNNNIKLAKQKDPLNIYWDRTLPKDINPSQVTVSKDAANRYFISILVEADIKKLPKLDNSIGIDVGLSHFFTLSDGTTIDNPRNTKKEEKRLARAQRRASHKKLGSKNRAKANLKVAKIHAKIKDRRKDFLHKTSTQIIRENQTIGIEDLSVRNMLQNKTLSKAIQDASWYEFRRQLEYKADWYGREIVAIDRFYPSSKTCSDCGQVVDKLPLDIREWTCVCGVVHDRDHNAAKNIEAVALAVLACGDGIRTSMNQESTISDY